MLHNYPSKKKYTDPLTEKSIGKWNAVYKLRYYDGKHHKGAPLCGIICKVQGP